MRLPVEAAGESRGAVEMTGGGVGWGGGVAARGPAGITCIRFRKLETAASFQWLLASVHRFGVQRPSREAEPGQGHLLALEEGACIRGSADGPEGKAPTVAPSLRVPSSPMDGRTGSNSGL